MISRPVATFTHGVPGIAARAAFRRPSTTASGAAARV